MKLGAETEVPLCVTVNVWPAIVIVPLLDDVAELADTLYPTEPLPDPVLPLVTVRKDALLVAVQPHPAVVLTASVLEDAPALTEAEDDDSE